MWGPRLTVLNSAPGNEWSRSAPPTLLPFLVLTIRTQPRTTSPACSRHKAANGNDGVGDDDDDNTRIYTKRGKQQQKITTTAKLASNDRIPFSIDKHLLKRCRYGCTSRWSTGTEDRGVMTASGYPRCEGVKFAWTEKRSVTTRHTGASAGMHISALGKYTFLQSGLNPSTVRNTPFCSRDYTFPLSGIHLSTVGITPFHRQEYTFLQPRLIYLYPHFLYVCFSRLLSNSPMSDT